MRDTFLGVLPLFAAELLHVIVLLSVRGLVLWLPRLIGS
jgi:hypothetical protein